MNLIDCGFGSFVSGDKVLSITPYDSSPVRRIVKDCKAEGKCVDFTFGRKTRSVLLQSSDNGIICTLSSIMPTTLIERYKKTNASLIAELIQDKSDEVSASK